MSFQANQAAIVDSVESNYIAPIVDKCVKPRVILCGRKGAERYIEGRCSDRREVYYYAAINGHPTNGTWCLPTSF